MRRLIPALAVTLLSLAPPARAAAPDTTLVGQLRAEADSLGPLFRSKLVKGFLAGTARLPHVAPRTVWYDSARTRYWRDEEAAEIPELLRAKLLHRVLDESFYYVTRYGSPLAYSRPLEILAEAGFESARGKRIADFGYGTIGHLRLLAQMGADVHGIEVDPLLRKLYAGDTGKIEGGGTLALHHGQWPAEAPLVAEVGAGYDLFLSKNTLKNGYIHPEQPVNPRMLVHLGVGDTAYVEALRAAVRPGGFVMIYNLCPAPAAPGKPYIPWADGRCPFPRELWEAQGFEVLAFDRDDSPAARAMGHALGWDQGNQPMKLDTDLFATYTLVKRGK